MKMAHFRRVRLFLDLYIYGYVKRLKTRASLPTVYQILEGDSCCPMVYANFEMRKKKERERERKGEESLIYFSSIIMLWKCVSILIKNVRFLFLLGSCFYYKLAGSIFFLNHLKSTINY